MFTRTVQYSGYRSFLKFLRFFSSSLVQLPNGLLNPPLVSPALSHLDGLPPLFFIVGDKVLLRDENTSASSFHHIFVN